MSEDGRVRMDKWLWAARFYKTRSQAKAAIEGGKVHVEGQRVKVGKEVRPGMVIELRQGFDEKTVEVKALSEVRGPASVAQQLYEETPESLAARAAAGAAAGAEPGASRPSSLEEGTAADPPLPGQLGQGRLSLPCCRRQLPRRPKASSNAPAQTTADSTRSPAISSVSTSPTRSGATPSGVPVMTTSPGSSVKIVLM